MTDMKLMDQVSRHENDGHEIGGQYIYISFENRLHYNAVCNSFQNNGRIQVTAACVFLLTWATMKDTVIVAIESNSFEFTL